MADSNPVGEIQTPNRILVSMGYGYGIIRCRGNLGGTWLEGTFPVYFGCHHTPFLKNQPTENVQKWGPKISSVLR